VTPTNSNDSETDTKPPAQPDIEEGVRVEESKSQETELNVQSLSSSSHQPIANRTRLVRSISREREAGLALDVRMTRSRSAKRVNTPVTKLASENQVTTRSQSAEQVNTLVTTPRTTPHNLTPNKRGRQ